MADSSQFVWMVPVASYEAYAPAYKRRDQFATWYMPENNTPGMAVAITNRERLLTIRCYGFADLAD